MIIIEFDVATNSEQTISRNFYMRKVYFFELAWQSIANDLFLVTDNEKINFTIPYLLPEYRYISFYFIL